MVRQQAWTNADVEQYFTSVKAAVAACSGVTWKDSGGNSYTLQPLTAPEIGDESISWTVTIELNGTTPMTSFSQQTAGPIRQGDDGAAGRCHRDDRSQPRPHPTI